MFFSPAQMYIPAYSTHKKLCMYISLLEMFGDLDASLQLSSHLEWETLKCLKNKMQKAKVKGKHRWGDLYSDYIKEMLYYQKSTHHKKSTETKTSLKKEVPWIVVLN